MANIVKLFALLNINTVIIYMMIRTRLILTKHFCTGVSQYLSPYINHIQTMPEMPKIKVKSEK